MNTLPATAPAAEPLASLPVLGDEESRRSRDIRNYLRGSSFLFSGRVVSLLLNFAVQIVTVRVLSKSDYGAFAYALGVVSLASSAVVLGMDKAIARFVPMFQERGEDRKAYGTLALATALVWGLGLSAVLLVFGLRGVLAEHAVASPLSLALVLTLIVLAPIQAFDSVLQQTLAIFVGARSVFFRRHVAGPTLKLAAVLLVATLSGDVLLLAYGYLAGGMIGVGLYLWILVRAWGGLRGGAHLRFRGLEVPAREVLGYSLPLLSSDLLVLIPGSIAVIVLEHFHPTDVVAEFRAVVPVARMNHMVLQSFAMLYIPLASRLFARGDRQGLNDLYWQTATWIAVLTFPMFVATFCLAGPVTTLLFGAHYTDSASLLAIMALGWYFNAALGFNASTLRVHGQVRTIVGINLTAATVGLAVIVMLSARFGAMGAAIGTTVTLVLQNLLNHAGLLVADVGVRLLDWRFLKTYLIIGAMTGVLMMVERVLAPPLYVGVSLAAGAFLLLLRLCRDVLQAEQTFPKLLRIPLLRRILAGQTRPPR